MAGRDSTSALCIADGEYNAAFCRRADGTRRSRAFLWIHSTRGARAAHRRRRPGPHRAAVHAFLGLWSDPERLVLALSNGHGRRNAHADHLRLVHARWILVSRI